VSGIGDVEEGKIEAGDVALGVGVAAEAEEEMIAEGLEVGRVAGEFEFADDFGVGGIA